MAWVSKKETINRVIEEFSQFKLNEKTIFNWLKDGEECLVIKNRYRIGFEQNDIDLWIKKIRDNILTLNKEDYLQCFRFGVRAYYQDVTHSDFNRAKQRDVGEFLTNQALGKLGEIAVQKLLEKYNLLIDLDFTVTGQVASQDITRISTRSKVWDNPAVKVSIKSTKLKNVLLALPEKEVALKDRRSDIYILSQVGLFPNHILRLIKEYGKQLLNDDMDLVSNFEDIPVRLAGWTDYKTLTSKPAYTLEEQKEEFGWKMNGPNFIMRSGALLTDWVKLKDVIVNGIQ